MNPKVKETLIAWDHLPDWEELCIVVSDLIDIERQLGRDEAIEAIRKLHPEI